MAFIRNGQLDDTYSIAEIFLKKPRPLHDLLQKAVGWLLREAGKRDQQRLILWLRLNHPSSLPQCAATPAKNSPKKNREIPVGQKEITIFANLKGIIWRIAIS